MFEAPTVSIVTITYNHEKYIEEALNSFIMQRARFNFEVIVADDCSTDKTQQIIKKYAKLYPDIIRPILRTKNVGIEKNCIEAFQETKGKYIAFCEGDDYWLDVYKLQKQVDFLEAHSDYSMCFHPVKVIYESGEKESHLYPQASGKKNFTLKNLLRNNYIQSNSVLYRRQPYEGLPHVLPLDWYLHVYHARTGKIGFQNDAMSVYRKHPGGIWWESDKDISKIWIKYGLSHFALFSEMRKLVTAKSSYREIVETSMFNMINTLTEVDQSYHTSHIKEIIRLYPSEIELFVSYSSRYNKQSESSIYLKKQEIDYLKQEKNNRDETIKKLTQELTAIKKSRVWKMRNLAARVTGKEII